MHIFIKCNFIYCSHYCADVGKTRQAVNKSINEKTWNSHVFPKMKEKILNLLGFEGKIEKNDKEVEETNLTE